MINMCGNSMLFKLVNYLGQVYFIFTKQKSFCLAHTFIVYIFFPYNQRHRKNLEKNLEKPKYHWTSAHTGRAFIRK